MSRLRLAAVATVLAGVVVCATAGPAAAHDQLLDSSPADGERLSAPPTEISLTFSAEVLDMGAVIVVADPSGQDWSDGEPALAGGVVTVPVEAGMPEAGYEVRWRVVSSDGHPISGIIPFTVGDAEPLERELAAAASPAADPESTPAAAASPQTPEDGALLRTVLLGAAGAALAAALFALVRFLRRPRHAVASGSPTGSPDDRKAHS